MATRRTPSRATSARSTRARPHAGPDTLPDISNGISTAYGSPGRPVIEPADTSYLRNPTSLEEILRPTRASPRKKAAAKVPSVTRTTTARTTRETSTQPRDLEEVEEEEDQSSEEEASEDDMASRRAKSASAQPQANGSVEDNTSIARASVYDRQHLPRHPYMQPFRDGSSRRSTPQVSQAGLRRAAAPWDMTVFFHTAKRYLNVILRSAWKVLTSVWMRWLIFLLLFFVMAYDHLPSLPRHIERVRQRTARGVRVIMGMEEFERTPSKYEQAWQYFKFQYLLTEDDFAEWNMPELQWAYNLQFLKRIEDLEKRLQQLDWSVGNLTSQIRDDLPTMTVVQLKDGKFHIPDGFWLALHGKMTGDPTLWQAFLTANKDNLARHTEQSVEEQLALGQEQSTVVSRTLLEGIIRENYDSFLAEFRTRMNTDQSVFVTEVRKVASQVAADLIARHTSGNVPAADRAANKAGSDYLHNHVDEISSINFFSPYHGAQIWTEMTSPTAMRKQENWLTQWYANTYYPSQEPQHALRAWKDVGESWCAAKSAPAGKAQIGIWTSRPVTPDALVVEHIPRGGTLEIDAAPRELELWMDVGTEEMVQKVEQQMDIDVPAWDRIQCSTSPAPGLVCVAKGMYDIHDDNWVQNIWVPETIPGHKLASRRWVVRVVSNWGGENTCIYRLRLKGSPA